MPTNQEPEPPPPPKFVATWEEYVFVADGLPYVVKVPVFSGSNLVSVVEDDDLQIEEKGYEYKDNLSGKTLTQVYWTRAVIVRQTTVTFPKDEDQKRQVLEWCIANHQSAKIHNARVWLVASISSTSYSDWVRLENSYTSGK